MTSLYEKLSQLTVYWPCRWTGSTVTTRVQLWRWHQRRFPGQTAQTWTWPEGRRCSVPNVGTNSMLVEWHTGLQERTLLRLLWLCCTLHRRTADCKPRWMIANNDSIIIIISRCHISNQSSYIQQDQQSPKMCHRLFSATSVSVTTEVEDGCQDRQTNKWTNKHTDNWTETIPPWWR